MLCKLNPVAPQLAFCKTNFIHNLLCSQFVLKILKISIIKNITINYSTLSHYIFASGMTCASGKP